jgi:hypothetical protein
MMTQEQRDAWFSWHPPTEETAPAYAAIREAERMALAGIIGAMNDPGPVAARFERVNNVTRGFAVVIDQHAPDGDDKAAAIRCVRLMRNAANEALATMTTADSETINALLQVVVIEGWKVRWQACSAVACGGH